MPNTLALGDSLWSFLLALSWQKPGSFWSPTPRLATGEGGSDLHRLFLFVCGISAHVSQTHYRIGRQLKSSQLAEEAVCERAEFLIPLAACSTSANSGAWKFRGTETGRQVTQ